MTKKPAALDAADPDLGYCLPHRLIGAAWVGVGVLTVLLLLYPFSNTSTRSSTKGVMPSTYASCKYSSDYRLNAAGTPLRIPLNVTQAERADYLAHCRGFTQGVVGLGVLRRAPPLGQLEFIPGTQREQDLLILIRYYPRMHGEKHLPMAQAELVADALAQMSRKQRERTRVVLFLSSAYEPEDYKAMARYLLRLYHPLVRVDVVAARNGNEASWHHSVQWLKTDPDITLATVVLMLEDDYLCHPEFLTEIAEFYASHNPCIVFPSDYPDRYIRGGDINTDDGRVTVVAGRGRHWRSTTSTTVTYAVRMLGLLALDGEIAHPLDDHSASLRVRELAGDHVFMSPIPSLCAHVNTLLLREEEQGLLAAFPSSLYFDWWAMGRRALRRAQHRECFPVPRTTVQS